MTRGKNKRPGRKSPGQDVMRVSRKVVRELVSNGAEAVMMVGSHVRGDAYGESDVDICAIGRGRSYSLRRADGFLVSISWSTAKSWRRKLREPSEAGGAVPALRSAIILHDPRGVAVALKREAAEWTWDVLGKHREAWVADEFTGWAEEVHRLIGNIELGRPWAAAIQRSLLAVRLAPVLAVHHRILYDTENQLWDLVGKEMRGTWPRKQSAAFGIGGQTFAETCIAALELFILAAEEIGPVLNRQQREVVRHACAIARSKIGEMRKT